MKRIEITENCLVPGTEGPRTLFKDTVLDLDDNVAGQVIAAGRGRQVEDDAKPRDTSRQHLAEADRAAEAAAAPDAAQAALIATLVRAELEKAMGAGPANG